MGLRPFLRAGAGSRLDQRGHPYARYPEFVLAAQQYRPRIDGVQPSVGRNGHRTEPGTVRGVDVPGVLSS